MTTTTADKTARSKKSVTKVDDLALPRNLPTEEMILNARHAATFPPNTPHSVINHFRPGFDEASDQVADPRDAPKMEDPITKAVVVAPAGTVPDKAKRRAPRKGASKKVTPSAETGKKADEERALGSVKA